MEPRHVFTIPVKTEDFDPEDEKSGMFFVLKFEYTENYPEEIPMLEVEETNVKEDILQEMMEYLKEQMQQSLGMVMVFTVVSEALEWMAKKWEDIKDKEEREAKEKKEKEEEEERVRQ